MSDNDGIGGHIVTEPLKYEARECCTKAFEQGQFIGAERMLEVFRTKVTESGLFFIQKDDERYEPEASEYLDDIWAEYKRLKEFAK